MYPSKTRAQAYDTIRRNLNQVPPIDDGLGGAGAQPSQHPWPTNFMLSDDVDEAVAWFDMQCDGKIGGDTVPRVYPVGAQTANGPYSLLIGGLTPLAGLTDVRHVEWNDRPLRPVSLTELDRDNERWSSFQPTTPDRYAVERGTLLILPAPATSGTLGIMFGKQLWSDDSHTDTSMLVGVPTEFHPAIWKMATVFVCDRQPEDNVLQTLKMGIMQEIMGQGSIPGVLQKMKTFYNRRNRALQPYAEPRTPRVWVASGNR